MEMLLCAKCGEVLECKKNGVKVRYGYYSGYFHADLFECPKCGYKVLTGFSEEIFDPEAAVDFDFSIS